DLLVGEGTNLLAVDNNDADELPLLEHWDRKHGAITGKLGSSHRKRIAFQVSRRLLDINNVGDLFCERCTANGGFRVGTNYWCAPPVLNECGRCVMQADALELVALAEQ